MASAKRQYLHLVNFVLFGAVTLWTVVTDRRLAPGFAALAVGQGLLALLVLRRPAVPSARVVLAFLGASYFGLAYFVAVVVGARNTTQFWVIFVVTAAIFAPVLLLAWRQRATWVTRTRGPRSRQST